MSTRKLSVPPTIQGLKYLEPIGMGGFADVFKYEQLGLGRAVAVKVLLSDLGAAAQESFEVEANVMARLSTHPAIVSVYQAGQAADGRPYLVMEYCPRLPLSARIKKGPLRLEETLEIGIKIASAVETAHRMGVLHRDIKPANILFTEHNLPALTDFGISATTESAQKGQGKGMSVPWAPPEQLVSGQQMGPASDVYSLAATVWTMLVGHSPYFSPEGSNDNFSMSKRVRNDPLPPLRRQGAPPSLERVLHTAMAKKPELRYSTALEFARALQSIQTELHLSVTPDGIVDEHEDYETTAGLQDTGTQVVDPISINPDGYGTAAISRPWATGQTNYDSRWSSTGFSSSSGSASSTGSTPSGAFIAHGRGSLEAQSPREFTKMTPPTVVAEEPEIPQEPTPEVPPAIVEPVAKPARRSPGMLVGVLIGALLVAGGAYFGFQALTKAGQASQSKETEPSVSVKPKDPIGTHVPMVTDLKLTVAGDKVEVTWTNPSPAEGDSYLFSVLDPSQDPILQPTTETSIVVDAVPGKTCVQVQLVRENGRSSEPVKGCAP